MFVCSFQPTSYRTPGWTNWMQTLNTFQPISLHLIVFFQVLPLTAFSLCYLKQAEWVQDLQLQWCWLLLGSSSVSASSQFQLPHLSLVSWQFCWHILKFLGFGILETFLFGFACPALCKLFWLFQPLASFTGCSDLWSCSASWPEPNFQATNNWVSSSSIFLDLPLNSTESLTACVAPTLPSSSHRFWISSFT